MNTQRNSKLKRIIHKYTVFLPNKGKGRKEFDLLYARRKPQVEKAISKLQLSPSDFTKKGTEKIKNNRFGEYTIRISKGDRIFYDVDLKKREVYILRAGKHDHYKLL